MSAHMSKGKVWGLIAAGTAVFWTLLALGVTAAWFEMNRGH